MARGSIELFPARTAQVRRRRTFPMSFRLRLTSGPICMLLVLTALTGKASPVAAVSPYPFPPFDFSHPSAPHYTLLSPNSGRTDRPLLVIYMQFSDVPSLTTASQVSQRAFGPTPSITDFFRRSSFDSLRIPAATPATSVDPFPGVISVNAGPIATIYANTCTPYPDGTCPATCGTNSANPNFDLDCSQGVPPTNPVQFFAGIPQATINRAVTLADPRIDFSTFDTNGNDVLDPKELLILVLRESDDVGANSLCGPVDGFCPWRCSLPGAPLDFDCSVGSGRALTNCGASRPNHQLQSLDNVSVGPGFLISTVDSATNTLSAIHELSHQALDHLEMRALGIGNVDVSGVTCGANQFFDYTSWHKLHFGWIVPTVVSRDGYYQIPQADTTGRAFILYDPNQGTNDYFIVENRNRGVAGPYDQNASDSGLVILRVDEKLLPPTTPGFPSSPRAPVNPLPLELMRPDGARTLQAGNNPGTNTDAWDPSDCNTPFRTMQRTWRINEPLDGGNGVFAPVAVRAIGPLLPVMRAYFDVRGPGILIDAGDYDPAICNSQGPPEVEPGSAVAVDLAIMNTDDAGQPAQSFNVGIVVPDGWSSTLLRSQSLLPQTPQQVAVEVAPPAEEPAGLYPVVARAIGVNDPTLTSESPFGIRVVPLPKDPDPWEVNDDPLSATAVPVIEHQHFDPRVLEDFATLFSSAERTDFLLPDLNLHDVADVDYLRVVLPDLRDPERGGHPELGGLPDCGSLESFQFDGQPQQVVITSEWDFRVLPPPRNAVGEALELLDPPGPAEGFSGTLGCPTSDGVSRVSLVFGRRTTNRSNFPDYEFWAQHRLNVTRIPAVADWLVSQIEVRGLSSLGSFPCPGGAFPICQPGPVRIQELHPFDPLRRPFCPADGCPDFVPFVWEGTAALDLEIVADAALSFELLDVTGERVAVAAPVASGLSASESSSLADADEPVVLEMFVADLEPGFYVLVVSGGEGSYAIEFSSPPVAADGDGDGIVDVFDPCPGSPEDLDGVFDGDGCFEPAITVKPGEDPTPLGVRSHGVVPVAILGEPGFDVGSVEPLSLRFGGCAAPGAPPVHDLSKPGVLAGHTKDVNGDGFPDLVGHYSQELTGLEIGDSRACLTGSSAGLPFRTSAAVNVR